MRSQRRVDEAGDQQMRIDLAVLGVAQLVLQRLGEDLHARLRNIVGRISGRRGDALLGAGIDDQRRLAMITLKQRSGKEYLLERLADFEITKHAKVARTFQNIRMFSGLTVLENLLVAQHNKLMQASGYTVLGLLGLPAYRQASKEAIELAKHWLEMASLVDRADDPAGDLPYGAQRRLEIARAMHRRKNWPGA